MIVVQVLLVLGPLIALPCIVALVTMAPLRSNRAGESDGLVIHIRDLFALLILMQVALAGVIAGGQALNGSLEVMSFFYVVVPVLVIVAWLESLRTLGRCGVRQVGRRMASHLILLPGVIAVMIGSVGVMFLFFHLLVSRDTLPQLLVVTCGLMLAAWALRRLAAWIAAEHAMAKQPMKWPVDQ